MNYIKKNMTNILIMSFIILNLCCLPASALSYGRICGYVREADWGNSISDATVCLTNGTTTRMDISLGNGYFNIETLDPGYYSLMVYDENGIPILGEWVEINIPSSGYAYLNAFAEGGGISGTIENSSSNPISEAEITVLKKASQSMVYYTTTDASGDYIVPRLPAGDYMISINKSGYGMGIIDDISVSEDEVTDNTDLTLQAAGSITGTVETTSSQAISGATVYAVPSGDDSYVMFNLKNTTTDGSGNYNINWLPTGTYAVIVANTGYVSDSTIGISVTSGQTNSDNDFSIALSGGAITGSVMDGATPIENAIVSCYSEGNSVAMATTNSSGEYSLGGLIAGTYAVVANANGFGLGIDGTSAVVTGTQTTTDIDFDF